MALMQDIHGESKPELPWRTPSKEKVEVGWPEQDKRKSKWWSDHAAGTWHFCFGGSVRGHGGHVPANQGLWKSGRRQQSEQSAANGN